jgi:hypothetical protein
VAGTVVVVVVAGTVVVVAGTVVVVVVAVVPTALGATGAADELTTLVAGVTSEAGLGAGGGCPCPDVDWSFVACLRTGVDGEPAPWPALDRLNVDALAFDVAAAAGSWFFTPASPARELNTPKAAIATVAAAAAAR